MSRLSTSEKMLLAESLLSPAQLKTYRATVYKEATRKKSKAKSKYPPQEQIDDFYAWLDDLDEGSRAQAEALVDIVWGILPEFASKWAGVRFV